MLKLNYQIHLILNSKYRLLVHLVVIFFIYTMIYGGKFVLCMDDNSNWIEVPRVAESKEPVRPSEQIIALRRNIQAFADSRASLLEQINKKNQLIDELRGDKDFLERSNLELRRQNGALGHTIHDLRVQVAELRDEVSELKEISDNNYNAYKEQCKLNGRLGHSIGELRQEISATTIENETLYEENSSLKDQLQVERNRVDNLRRALAEKKKILKTIK